MSLQATRRRRAWLLLAVGVCLTGLLAGTYAVRRHHIRERSLRCLVEGLAAGSAGNVQGALERLASCLHSFADDPVLLLAYARARSQAEDPGGEQVYAAISVLYQVLELEPGNAEAATRLEELRAKPGQAAPVGVRWLLDTEEKILVRVPAPLWLGAAILAGIAAAAAIRRRRETG